MSARPIVIRRLKTARCIAVFLLAVFPVQFVEAANRPVTLTPVQERLRAEHNRVLDDLNALDSQGNHLTLGEPRVPSLLKHGWDLAGEWASEYLEAHPNASAHDLKHIFDGFAPEPKGVKSKYGDFIEYPNYCFAGSAVSISAVVYMVGASYFRDSSTGIFMVVARGQDGRFHALWNIKDLAADHYAQRDEIGRWAHLVSRAYYNGPLDVSKILPIYPAANRHPRFAVDAFQSAEGGTILAQLSIWEWDGREAHPLLVRVYQYAADFGSLHFDGNVLRITTKEDTESFFSCGMCPEPRGVWTVRITSDGIQDLGHRFQRPEFEWADELLSKVQKGEDTAKLANSKVVEAVKNRIRIRQEEMAAEPREPSEKKVTDFYWGMLSGLRVLQRGQKGEFELDLDEAQFRFVYVMRNGKPYFTSVRIK